jgi:predicted DNA-binding protein
MEEKTRKKQIGLEVSDELNERLEVAAAKVEKKKAEFVRDAVREKIDQILNVNQKTMEQSI